MVILASQSPRRKQLLGIIFPHFDVRPTDCEESTKASTPEEAVVDIAIQKARAAACSAGSEDLIIAADTCVSIDGQRLGKPADAAEAYAMLSILSGRTHTVYTGVALLWQGQLYGMCEKTPVTFHPLTPEEINGYIATGEPFDKAGGYGIQGKGALLVCRIAGDFYNVMGLPVSSLNRLLGQIGALPQ